MPLNKTLAQRVLHELKDDDATADSLAELIQKEPALCLKLYLKARRKLNEREGSIQGLVHLIGLLGFNQIEEVVKQAPKQESHSAGQQELFSASLFAAELAATLLPEKHGTRGERFYLPSLLFNAPLWLMWSAAPKIMHHGQSEASEKRKALKPLCEKTLGFSLQSLLNQTQIFLPLPDLSLKALQVDLYNHIDIWHKVRRLNEQEVKDWAESDKELKAILFSPETGLYLINHYVLAIYLDWHGKHIRRWERFLASHLSMEPAVLREKVIDIANHLHEKVDSQYPSYLSGRFSPLYRFRQLHKALPSDKISDNQTVLSHYLTQLRETRQSNHCLQLAMEAFREGMHVEHCIILAIDKQELHIPLSFGLTNNSDNKKIDSKKKSPTRFSLAECGALFNKLLHKPTAIQVDNAQVKRLESQLPIALMRLWKPRPCGLMSLFHQGRPYAIVICDHRQWNKDKQSAFKDIGKQLAQTLKNCTI